MSNLKKQLRNLIIAVFAGVLVILLVRLVEPISLFIGRIWSEIKNNFFLIFSVAIFDAIILLILVILIFQLLKSFPKLRKLFLFDVAQKTGNVERFYFDSNLQCGTIIQRRRDPIEVEELVHKSKLRVTWDTFGDGIKTIAQQIHEYSPGFTPEIYIGVNENGAMIASALSGRKCSSYTIKTEGPERKVVWNLPSIEVLNNKNVVVVDTQYKSGGSISLIINTIKNQSTPNAVYLAVFTICGINLGTVKDCSSLKQEMITKLNDYVKGVPTFSDNFQKEVNKELDIMSDIALPHFIAYYTLGGISPPYPGLR